MRRPAHACCAKDEDCEHTRRRHRKRSVRTHHQRFCVPILELPGLLVCYARPDIDMTYGGVRTREGMTHALVRWNATPISVSAEHLTSCKTAVGSTGADSRHACFLLACYARPVIDMTYGGVRTHRGWRMPSHDGMPPPKGQIHGALTVVSLSLSLSLYGSFLGLFLSLARSLAHFPWPFYHNPLQLACLSVTTSFHALHIKYLTTAPLPPSSRARFPKTPPPTLVIDPNWQHQSQSVTQHLSNYTFTSIANLKKTLQLSCVKLNTQQIDRTESQQRRRGAAHHELLGGLLLHQHRDRSLPCFHVDRPQNRTNFQTSVPNS
eukprot:1671763-Rhodomonas_salina.5